MEDYLKCNICLASEHNDKFCRCEARNIRVAKEMRSRSESPWLKSQPERSKREDHESGCGALNIVETQ